MRAERTGTGYKHMIECFLCESEFQFGPHIYNSSHVSSWGTTLCKTCIGMNHDGIVTEQWPKLMRHLADKGVLPKLNARGWLDIPRN